MNSYFLLKLISVIVAAFSQILLKKSADRHYDSWVKEYLNILVIVGYTMFVLSSILSVFSLKGISLSLSSIIEAFSYILVPVLSYVFLKERINKIQFIGMVIIIVGVVIFNI